MSGAPNKLWYGDNLAVLRDHVADASVDLVYLDPPFNSNATYNVLFKSPAGEQSQAQFEAFDDTWHWNESAERAFDEVMESGNTDAAEMLRAMRAFLKENDMMAYLAMMAVRLIELHRVLKPTGSLYLHCDPTASHYLKILLDAVFGKWNFKNEITWKRAHTVKGNFGQGSRFFDRNTDSILFYTKSEKSTFNPVFTGYTDEYISSHYKLKDESGRRYQLISMEGPGGAAKGNPSYEVLGVTRYWRYSRERMDELISKGLVVQNTPGKVPRRKLYLDEGRGVPVQALWDDIAELNSQAQERLGYPTQKPLALLERILSASSNPGDVVLDPFCGCGTTVHAAEKLSRKWIGIDVTHLAISLIRRRLIDAFPQAKFDIEGVPKDEGGARQLAADDKHQFQLWALSMVDAQPYKGGRKGADGGVDGYLYFKPDGRIVEKAIVSVKGGGNVGVGMIRDLIATVDREKAKIGLFLTLEDPTTVMRREATAAGLYASPMHGKFEKIQILTVEDLFAGKKPHLPWIDPSVFKKAKRESSEKQGALDV